MVGLGQLTIALTFSGSIRIPVPLTIKPKNELPWRRICTYRFQHTWLNISSWKTLDSCRWCFLMEPFVAINISSIYTTTIKPPSLSISCLVYITNSIPSYGCNSRLISPWKVAVAFLNPNGITIHSYSPNLVLKAVNFSRPNAVRIEWNPPLIPIFVIKSQFHSLLDNSSMIGSRVLPFFVWSFRCWLSTHNPNPCPFGFGTNNIELPT